MMEKESLVGGFQLHSDEVQANLSEILKTRAMDAGPEVFLLVMGSCSIVGVAVIMIMHSLFSDGRDITGSTIFNFFGAVFMSQLFYVIGVGGSHYLQMNECCMALALTAQYLRTVESIWIFLMARTMHHSLKRTIGLVISSGAETHIVQHSRWKYNPAAESPSEFPLINKVMDVETTARDLAVTLGIGWGLPLFVLILAVILEALLNSRSGGPLLGEPGRCWFLNDQWCLTATFLIPNFLLVILTLKELVACSVMTRRARHLLFSQKCTRIAFMYIFLAVKLQLLVSSVNAVGLVSVFSNNAVTWAIFHVLSSVKGVIVSISLACDCQLMASFDRAFRREKRKNKRSGDHEMLTGTSKDDGSSIELL